MKLRFLLTLLIFPLISTSLYAATMIEIKDSKGISTIYSDGIRARMETPGDEGYMIVDSGTGDAYAVMPSQRQVMKMTVPKKTASVPKIKTKFKKSGKGPSIVGYRTSRIDYYAGGEHCGTHFTSKAALKDIKMEKIFDVIRKMSRKARSFSRQFGNQQRDPCKESEEALIEKFTEIGMPLRSLGRKGDLDSEVIRINKNAKLPPNAFRFPSNYEVRDMREMEKYNQRQMEHAPQIDEMMKQLRESGNLPPGVLEQMNKMRQQQRY